jgi:hypothetical protein
MEYGHQTPWIPVRMQRDAVEFSSFFVIFELTPYIVFNAFCYCHLFAA